MPGVVVVNQPGVYFVDADGNEMSADDATTIASHEGIIVAGKDGTVLRFMRVASDGTLRIDPTGTTTQPISAASLPLPTGAATEATVATLATETKLEAVRVLLASLDGKDYATETKLEAVRVLLSTIDADTGQILLDIQELLARFGDNIASPAADSLLARIQEQIDLLTTIDADTSNLDVALSTRATEATLSAADTKLGTIDADTGQMLLDIQELLARVGDNIASPAADTLQARLQELIDNTGVGASPTADTVQARLQEQIDLQTTIDADTGQILLDIQELLARVGDDVASPAADTLQARLQELIDNLGVGASPTADTVQARLQEQIDLQTTIDADTSILSVPTQDYDTGGGTDDVVMRGIALPASGGNVIGGTPTNPVAEALYDGSGNPVAVVLDNSIYRLETRNTVVGQVSKTGAEVKVTTIADKDNPTTEHRFQTEARIAPNSRVSIVPVGIGEEDLGNLFRQFLTDDGTTSGDDDMIVDGSGTPVDFWYPAHATKNTVLTEVRLGFTALSLNWGGASVGKGGPALTGGGIELNMIANNGTLVDFGNITVNEEFLMLPVRASIVLDQGGNRDVLALSIDLGGLAVLEAGSGDEFRITINDDLTTGTRDINYFKAAVYGVLVDPP